MATVASLLVDLRASTAAFQSDMRNASQAAAQNMGAIRQEAQRTSDSIGLLNKAAGSFIGFEAIKSSVAALLDAQKAAQQIHYSLLSATGSTNQADQAFKQVSETSERLGLDLQSSALGFAQMSAAANANGVSMKDQLALFDGLARSSTVLHLSSTQTGDAILALSQIFGKGKIQAQELTQQLGNAIPGVVPRFQQAVLAMTKGTDLAGKSFDQLLQAGDLSVQRFLPALVEALNATGKGAEGAAGGLNAEMNRLTTAWFKLKADLSTGLVSDATIGGIKLLAGNLSTITSLAGVAGSVAAARLAGTGLGKVSDSASGWAQQQAEARAAAVAASELAAEAAGAAAAQIKNTEAAIAGAAAARQQALAQREVALALYAKALAENEAAQATLAHQKTTVTLSANIRAEQEATAQATIAQQNLTRATAQYDGAIAGSAALKQQQIALEGRLVEAKAASAAATEAQVVAERQLAATSAAGLLSRGAASLGSAALALVGGPWGAAALAIGGVAYAIYESIKASEAYRQETDNQVKSLQQLKQTLKETADSYGTLDSSLNFGKALEGYNAGTQQISDAEKELASLRAEADRLNGVLRASASTGGIGNAIADADTQKQLDLINGRIAEVSGQLNGASVASDQLAQKLAGALAPALAGVKAGFADLAKADGIADFLGRLNGLGDVVANRAKDIQDAQGKITQYGSDLAALDSSLTKKLLTDGKTQTQQVEAALKSRIEAINKAYGEGSVQAKKLTADAQASAAPTLQKANTVDSADAAKKAATASAAETKRWATEADNLNNSLQQTHNELLAQLDSTTKLTPAEKTLQDILGGTDAAYNHASAALRTKMLAQAQDNAELSRAAIAQQQATKDAEAYAVVQENLQRIALQSARERQDSLFGIGHGSQQTQDQQALTTLQRQYTDLMSQASRSFIHGDIDQPEYAAQVQAYKAQLAEELKAEQDNFAQRDALQSDWHTGARAALQDYALSAANVAGQTQQAFSSAFQSLEDAETSFVTKGKVNFGSLITSWISDLTRMEMRAANSAIFNGIGSLLGLSTGTGASSIYSLGGSGDTSYLGSGVSSLYGVSGRASGGPTSAGTIYEVAERGPELYQAGGRVYLLSNQNGNVVPASGVAAGSSAGGSNKVALGSSNALKVVINNHGTSATDSDVSLQQGGNGMEDILTIVNKQVDNRVNQHAANANSAMVRTLKRTISGRGVPVVG